MVKPIPDGYHSVTPYLILNAASDVDDARRTEIGPGELLFSGPHPLDRLAGGFRQAGRFDGRFPRVLAAIRDGQPGVPLGLLVAHAAFTPDLQLAAAKANARELDAKRPVAGRRGRAPVKRAGASGTDDFISHFTHTAPSLS